MAKTVVFAEQRLSSFIYTDDWGFYVCKIHPSPFIIEVGKTYTVMWDGISYECAAQDGSSVLTDFCFVGNATAYELLGNNEPFIIGITGDSYLCVCALNDTEATEHTVAIYVEAPEKGIIVKDRDGKDATYVGAAAVRVRTLDGSMKNFINIDELLLLSY